MQLDLGIAQYILPVVLAVVMFGMGLELSISEFRRVLKTPAAAALGTFGHFIVMPGLAFLVVKLLDLPYEIALGVILVGSCPSGTTSNMINYIAKGDIALAITITSFSTLICPIFTPLVVVFLGSQLGDTNSVSIPFLDMLTLVIAMIGVPVGLGMLVHKKAPEFAKKAERFFKLLALVALIGIIIYVIIKNQDDFFDMVALVGLAVILHNIFGLTVGYVLPRMLGFTQNQSRTISIEMAIQNTTLGMTLAVAFFSATVALPSAVFSLWMYIAGIALALFWGKHPPTDEARVEA